MDDHENPLGIEPYVLPDDLIREARDISSTLSRSIEEISGTFLVHRQVTAIIFQDGPKTVELSASEIARFLGQLRHLTLDSATPTPRRTPEIKFIGTFGANILRFIEIFFEELRGIICKRAKSLSGTSHTVIVALASWLAGKLGVAQPMATAVATAILVAVLTATEGAFCKMSTKEARASLGAVARPTPKTERLG
jgi:hypothetical protein